MLPLLTNKQQEILTLLYRFRFLNRIQLQELLNHAYHNRINAWLRNLLENEYIKTYHTTGYSNNTLPRVYSLGIAGITWLKKQKGYSTNQLKNLYREDVRSYAFVKRCVFLADMYLDLLKQNIKDTTFSPFTKSDLSHQSFFIRFSNGCIPDLYIHKQQETIATEYLIELIDENVPRYKIRKKLRAYISLYFSNNWENAMKTPFPHILIICPTAELYRYIKAYIRSVLKEHDAKDLTFRLANSNDVSVQGVTAEIWEEVG